MEKCILGLSDKIITVSNLFCIVTETTKNESDSFFLNSENQNSRPTRVSLGKIDILQQEIISKENVNNMQLRCSERLKNKQLSDNLSECVPNN